MVPGRSSVGKAPGLIREQVMQMPRINMIIDKISTPCHLGLDMPNVRLVLDNA